MRSNLFLLIDHANVDYDKVNLLKLIKSWLLSLSSRHTLPSICDVYIRAYGGWNYNGMESEARFEASAFYQQLCPSMIKIGDNYFIISFCFAEHLLLANHPNSTPFLFNNTVVVRKKLQSLNIVATPECDVSSCELEKIRKWLRSKKACTNTACSHAFSDVFSRKEQKQVDIHLCLDFVSCVADKSDCHHVGLVTSDFDLIPALVMVLSKNPNSKDICLIRTEDYTSYADSFLAQNGIHILPLQKD